MDKEIRNSNKDVNFYRLNKAKPFKVEGAGGGKFLPFHYFFMRLFDRNSLFLYTLPRNAFYGYRKYGCSDWVIGFRSCIFDNWYLVDRKK